MPRMTVSILTFMILAMVGFSQEANDPLALRYGIQANVEIYPQKTPEDALKSLVRALDNKRFDYVLAHLTNPKFVDERIAEYRASITQGKDESKTFLAFDRFVRETEQHFKNDPQLLRELRFFAREGVYEINETQAEGKAASVPARKTYLRKHSNRWFVDNRQ